LAAVARKAARHVERKDAGRMGIDGIDRIGERAFQVARQSAAEDRVHQQVGARVEAAGPRDHGASRGHVIVMGARRVAGEAVRGDERDRRHVDAARQREPREHVPVAAVVAAAADDLPAARTGKLAQCRRERGFARALHKCVAGYAGRDRPPVDAAHALRRIDGGRQVHAQQYNGHMPSPAPRRSGGPDPAALKPRIREWSAELGFQALGVADVDLAEAEARLRAWLDEGFHGEMAYMERHGTRRTRPAELVPGTLRVISVRMDYLPEPQARAAALLDSPDKAYVSRYALGRDYHKVLRGRLRALARRIEAEIGAFGHRVFVDSAPVMEKPLAEKAGLGWIGKHT